MYSECIHCSRIGSQCDGPNFMAMSADQLLDWCKKRKAALGWTSAQLAEAAGIPKGTIDRLLSGNPSDFKYETIRPVLKTLVGGSFEGNPCPTPPGGSSSDAEHEAALAELRAENARLKDRIINAEPQHREDIEKARTEERAKIDYLKKSVAAKNKVIAALAILLLVALVVIIIALIVDMTNPDRGYFWMSQMFQTQGVPKTGSIR